MNRVNIIQKQLRKEGVSALIVTNPVNVRYLSNFVGTNGWLVVSTHKIVLVTDFRYFITAKKLLQKGISVYDYKLGLKPLFKSLKKIAFESEHITVSKLANLKKQIPKIKWKGVSGWVEKIRMNKGLNEVNHMRYAAGIGDAALIKLQKFFKPGITEGELESKLHDIILKLGAEEFSFPPIITFGKDTADVHHQKKSDNKLKKGEKVLIDFGVKYNGYCSDMTRVFHFSSQAKSKDEQKMYSIVLDANQKAISSIHVGQKFSDLDKVARGVIDEAGYGEYFGHSTGHGVGLDIHETPNVSELSKDTVQPGMVFTIEPGIYIEGKGGVRIEDMVYIKPDGKVEVLTKSLK